MVIVNWWKGEGPTILYHRTWEALLGFVPSSSCEISWMFINRCTTLNVLEN